MIGPDLVPKGLRFRHRLYVLTHDCLSCEESQNRELSKTAEEELFAARLFEPLARLLGMHVSCPEQSQPHVRIKEIQRVHRSDR